MNDTTKKLALEALLSKLSAADDNLYRAKTAASWQDADKLYGSSGQTLNQIIEGYQREVDKYRQAIRDLQESKP